MGAKHFFQLCKPTQVKFSSIYETQAKKVQQRQNLINIYIRVSLVQSKLVHLF